MDQSPILTVEPDFPESQAERSLRLRTYARAGVSLAVILFLAGVAFLLRPQPQPQVLGKSVIPLSK